MKSTKKQPRSGEFVMVSELEDELYIEEYMWDGNTLLLFNYDDLKWMSVDSTKEEDCLDWRYLVR